MAKYTYDQPQSVGAANVLKRARQFTELRWTPIEKMPRTAFVDSEENPKEAAELLARGTNSQSVQVIGRKIVLYREAREKENRKIVLDILKKRKTRYELVIKFITQSIFADCSYRVDICTDFKGDYTRLCL